jgi:splicing factor 3B subunit 5
MNDRYNIQNQVEHLQMKYVGTGHADLSKWEWGTNMQRDSLASHIGHHSRLVYFSVAENQTISRMKYNMIMDMIRPCGPPTKKDKDDK